MFVPKSDTTLFGISKIPTTSIQQVRLEKSCDRDHICCRQSWVCAPYRVRQQHLGVLTMGVYLSTARKLELEPEQKRSLLLLSSVEVYS